MHSIKKLNSSDHSDAENASLEWDSPIHGWHTKPIYKASVGVSLSTLTLYTNYAGVISIQDLYGKRSQDPYAWVYLLDKEGRCFFQAGNER